MELSYDRDTEEYVEQCRENQNFPRNDALKLIVLERLLEAFEESETYTKSDVNAKIKQYFDEYILIRREFVNFGYLQYDNRQNTYTVKTLELSIDEIRDISRLERHARDLGILD